MVVVAQLLAADQYAPGHDVGGRGGYFEAAIAHAMTESIDDARCEEGLSNQLHAVNAA